LHLYFSEACGACRNGKIYKIENNQAKLYYEVKIPWAGDFGFDEEGNLYLSSGNRVPASIYKVVNGEPIKIYTANELIKGFIVRDNAIYYANWRDKIYKLDLNSMQRSVVYSNSSKNWISDVAFRSKGPATVTISLPDLMIEDITSVKRGDYYYVKYLIKNVGNADAGQSKACLYIDGKYVASDTVQVDKGRSKWGEFGYKIKGHSYNKSLR